jgi:hypothetical protein
LFYSVSPLSPTHHCAFLVIFFRRIGNKKRENV